MLESFVSIDDGLAIMSQRLISDLVARLYSSYAHVAEGRGEARSSPNWLKRKIPIARFHWSVLSPVSAIFVNWSAIIWLVLCSCNSPTCSNTGKQDFTR